MNFVNVKLQIMYFLDILSFAMTVSTIPPLILSIGGSHFVLGIFGSGSVLIQMLSIPFLRAACELYGKKYILLFCSISNFILSLNLMFLRSYWSIVLNRWFYAFVNHTQTLHKSLIVDKPNKDLINNFLQTSAFVVGPVTSGYFFDKKGGVSYVFFIASSLLLINILNSMTVKHEVKEKSSFVFMDTVLRRMWSSVATGVDTLKRSNIKENWDLLVLKSLMVANATVLFTKFPAILKHNFRLGSFLIGCTSGYQQILMYASGASAPFMKRNLFVSVPNIQRLVIWTVLFVTSLIVVCFAASHNHYLVMYMPMILGRSLVDNIWLDLAVMRKNSFLINAADIVTLVTRLIVPFTVGTLCLIYGHIAIKISMIVPVVLVLLLILLKGKSLDIIRRLSVTKIDLSKSNKAD